MALSLLDKAKQYFTSKSQDNEGWLRQGKFTPVKQLTNIGSGLINEYKEQQRLKFGDTSGSFGNQLKTSLPGQVEQKVKNIFSSLSTPEKQSQFNQIPVTNLSEGIRAHIKNNYIAPIAQVPYNLKQTFGKDKTLLQRGAGALGTLGGTIAMIPDPIGDVAYPLYNYWKGQNQATKQGASFSDAQKAGAMSMIGHTQVGLGDAISNNSTVQNILNLAELPLSIFAVGKISKTRAGKNVVLNNEKQIIEAVNGISNLGSMEKNFANITVNKAERLAKQLIPGIENNPEIKQLKASNPDMYLKTIQTWLYDTLQSARDPKWSFGNSIRKVSTPEVNAEQILKKQIGDTFKVVEPVGDLWKSNGNTLFIKPNRDNPGYPNWLRNKNFVENADEAGNGIYRVKIKSQPLSTPEVGGEVRLSSDDIRRIEDTKFNDEILKKFTDNPDEYSIRLAAERAINKDLPIEVSKRAGSSVKGDVVMDKKHYYIDVKQVGDKIIVNNVNGRPVNKIFTVDELYNSQPIINKNIEVRQPTLSDKYDIEAVKVFDKYKELVKQKESGLITEETFNAKTKNIHPNQIGRGMELSQSSPIKTGTNEGSNKILVSEVINKGKKGWAFDSTTNSGDEFRILLRKELPELSNESLNNAAPKILQEANKTFARGKDVYKIEVLNGKKLDIPIEITKNKNYYNSYNPATQVSPIKTGEVKQPTLKIKVSDNGMATNNQGVVHLGRKLSPQVDSTTTLPKQSVIQSEVPKLKGVGQAETQVSSSEPIIDPVAKIINALKEAKPTRGQQEALYSKARGQKFARMMSARSRVGGEKGFYAELGSLKGELPKVQFETLRNSLKQSDIDTLFNRVKEANIGDWEKVTAQTGLSKILGAEGGVVPTKGEISLLDEVFGKEFTTALLEKRSLMEKLMATLGDVLNVPRSLMASVDLSAPMRQGIFLVGHPKQWSSAFGGMFKSFGSEKAYQGILDEIASRPTYKLMRENRLAITKPNSALAGGEEAFMSNLAERIPGVGKLIKGSDRAYSAFLNKLRADVFDDLVKKGKDLNLGDDKEFLTSVTSFVNAATGRGNLPKFLEGSSQALNGVFFSPRLMASRLNLLNPAYYAKLHPTVRKEALKSLLTFAGTGITALSLASLAGAEVGTDPRSSDFGKIKIGNTRYDIWGGFQQYIKLASQLITGKLISSTTGKEYTLGEGYKPLTRAGIVAKFFQSKESPIASFVMSMLEGTNAIGDKFSLPEETIGRLMPMMIQDMYDLQKEWGPKGILMGIPGIFGVGSQTYGKQIPTQETTPAGKQTIKLKGITGLPEDIMMKIKGTSPSNIPQDQWKSIVDTKTQESQNAVLKDKVKQDAIKGNLQPQGSYIPLVIDGEVKIIDTSFQPEAPELTGNTELDKKLISKYKGQLTQKANDIVSLYEAQKITKEEAEKQLEELKVKSNSLKKGSTKSKGGKITIAKVATPTVRKFKLPTIKLPNTSLKSNIKIKKPSIAQLKKRRTIKIKV